MTVNVLTTILRIIHPCIANSVDINVPPVPIIQLIVVIVLMVIDQVLLVNVVMVFGITEL